jgi:hypothetical protein
VGGRTPICLGKHLDESQKMPNQRNPNKRQLNIWRHEKDMNVLRQVAKDNDITMSELLEVLIDDFQVKRKSEQKKFLRDKRKE